VLSQDRHALGKGFTVGVVRPHGKA
jgi:hypothetical protein